MSSPKQVAANRANSQHSTGPTSPDGRKAAAGNSVTHGLSASPETLFAAEPDAETAYRDLALRLRRDCIPDGELEEETFQQYAWAIFQAKRARQHEIFTEDRWLDEPDNSKCFSQMERVIKLGALLERRASKALRELRQLQRDRFATYEVYAEHCVMGKEVQIPRSLPVSEIRQSNLNNTNPNYLAQFLMYTTPEVKKTAIRMLKDAKKNEQKAARRTDATNEANLPANPLRNMSMEELMELAKAAGINQK